MSDKELLQRIRAAIEQLAPAVKRHPAINSILNQLSKVEAQVKHDVET
jgi:hypothetical protein